jgi:small nuclear ribonucleoprotein (snRNP)-like protein
MDDAEEHEIKMIKTVKKVDENTTQESVSYETQLKRKIGTVFIRGDTITVLAPE